MLVENTEVLAQRTSQMLRIQKHLYTAEHHHDGAISILTSEGDLPLVIDNNQRFIFALMLRGRVESLDKWEGLSGAAAMLAETNVHNHGKI